MSEPTPIPVERRSPLDEPVDLTKYGDGLTLRSWDISCPDCAQGIMRDTGHGQMECNHCQRQADKPITATEVAAGEARFRAEAEKAIGAAFDRIREEVTAPLIDRMMEILVAHGSVMVVGDQVTPYPHFKAKD